MINPYEKLSANEIMRDFAIDGLCEYETNDFDSQKKEQMIVALIQANAISLAPSEHGCTLLDKAIEINSNILVAALIKAGADLDYMHPKLKLTTLMRAVIQDNIPAFEMLIQSGANWKLSYQAQRMVMTEKDYQMKKITIDLRQLTNENHQTPSQETKKYVNDFLDCMEEKEKLSMSTVLNNQTAQSIQKVKKDSHKI